MNSKKEYWTDVYGYVGLYSVSSMGRVRSEQRIAYSRKGIERPIQRRILKPGKSTYGYNIVNLTKDGKQRVYTIARLSLTSFIGPPTGKMDARHLDGNKTNDTLNNLRWGTRLDNEHDKIQHGRTNRGERNGQAKLTNSDVHKIRAIGNSKSQAFLAKQFNVTQSVISNILAKRTWKHVN